jgi:hypothetical protein
MTNSGEHPRIVAERHKIGIKVTAHPSAQWTTQQLVEAFSFDTAPRYLLRDGDGIYAERVRRRPDSLGIDEIVTAPASPWQNPYSSADGGLGRCQFSHPCWSRSDQCRRLRVERATILSVPADSNGLPHPDRLVMRTVGDLEDKVVTTHERPGPDVIPVVNQLLNVCF